MCDKILSLDALSANALNTRGVALGKLRRYEEALASYDAALAVAPERADIIINRGTTLLDLDRVDEALASFDAAIAREPENLAALINHGNACVRNDRFKDALDSFDKAQTIRPDRPSALIGRGIALAEMGRFEEAIACHDQALRIEPHVVAAHVNRGNAMLKVNRVEDALDNYNNALAIEPENAEANFNAAVTRLCLGDYKVGWEQYEYRWQKKQLKSDRREFPRPMWRGEKDIQGKTIFLHSEQGFGDSLQFVRYAPMVAALGARVSLAVPPALRELLGSVAGVAQVLTDGDATPDFDLHCPLLSLPLAFGTELETVPAEVPYLWPSRERLEIWSPRLPSETGRLRVGLCWAGNPGHVNDRNRSLPLAHLADVLSLPNIDFVSIQREVKDEGAEILRSHGVLQLGGQFTSFSDTAAVVALLDLVVAVDTSVAHLAGAMGKGTALLLPFSPDWRWLLDRTDSPWYPSMRIFRQTESGDWSGPVARLRDELHDAAERRIARLGQ
jgi:Tfp pilus assembly protein PilF